MLNVLMGLLGKHWKDNIREWKWISQGTRGGQNVTLRAIAILKLTQNLLCYLNTQIYWIVGEKSQENLKVSYTNSLELESRIHVSFLLCIIDHNQKINT